MATAHNDSGALGRLTKRSGQQGQAMVEFSILMLALVPLLLYGFYLMDAVYYQLDMQESVISTVWDASQRNHQVKPGPGREDWQLVAGAARLEYSDHTSAYDDPQDIHGDRTEHHTALAAHLCYLGHVQDGSAYGERQHSTQITCSVDSEADLTWMNGGLSLGGLSGLNPAYAYGKSDMNKGGVVKCWAKGWIYNYLIPDVFMPEFSHVKDGNGEAGGLTNKASKQVGYGYNDAKSSVHNDNGINVFVEDQAAISADTWAIENAGSFDATTNLNTDNPFYRRVRNVYYGTGIPFDGDAKLGLNALTGTYTAAAAAMTALAGKAANKVEYIPAIPLMPTNSLTGAVPGIGSLLNNLGTNPSDPAGVYLVAKWNRSSGTPTIVQCAGVDAECLAGPKYESTPFQNSPKAPSAFSKRGMYYMGSKNPNQDWYPQ